MKYKLVPGKWCSECCFGIKNENGIIICHRGPFGECSPGQTVYAAVPATNGDRIRAMSNEELAEEFDNEYSCPPSDSREMPCNHLKCRQCWLDWLNKEANTETEGNRTK